MTQADVSIPLTWSLDHQPSDQDIRTLRKALIDFNITAASIDASRDLAVFIHDAHGRLRGGIVAKYRGNVWRSTIYGLTTACMDKGMAHGYSKL